MSKILEEEKIEEFFEIYYTKRDEWMENYDIKPPPPPKKKSYCMLEARVMMLIIYKGII